MILLLLRHDAGSCVSDASLKRVRPESVGVRNAAHAGLAGHSLPVQSAASLAAMQVTIIAMSSRRVERSES